MPLFHGMETDAVAATIECLAIRLVSGKNKETLIRAGDRATSFGIVLSGSVNILRYAADGQVELIANLGVGDIVGASYVLSGIREYPIDVIAHGDTRLLILDGYRLLHPCKSRCIVHTQLISRILVVLAERNVRFSEKIECISRRRTTDRLLAYLHRQARIAGSDEFEIPFTRQQLADYLNVERTALCCEIGKLVAEGVLETDRKLFRLIRRGVKKGIAR